MDIEKLRTICNSLPAVKEDIKWGHDLCFTVGEKMFCVTGLEGPFAVSFKVPDEDFEMLCSEEGFEPAPYMACNKWVLVSNDAKLKLKDWERYVKQSYELVKEKLSKKLRKELKID